MTKFTVVSFLTICSTQLLFAQHSEPTDSIETVSLDNLVITGQYNAQSVDKSLYQVELISSEDIKNFAGNTVADVLNQNLNMLIIPSRNSGDANAEMLGLNGSYVKVLVDNIPLVSDTGLGNNVDLTKINLDNVERIEIVRGAMGVDYGNNALAGIINIITKKNFSKKWKINATVQEETVGDEYDWYENGGISKGKGRHIQALDISHKFSDKWSASVGVNRNNFQGFWGDRKGKKYFEQDGLRGYDWLPKEQWNGNAMLRFQTQKFKAFYKLSYLNEEINFYNPIVNQVNYQGGERSFTANDRNYFTDRWTHHLNLYAKLINQLTYNGDFSYQTQKRNYQNYVYDIPQRTVLSKDAEIEYLSTKVFYSRGTLTNFFTTKKWDLQLGYELNNTNGFANQFASSFGYTDNLKKEIGTYAGFVSAEFFPYSDFSIRPGFRASFSNKFKPQYNYSLNTKYDLSKHSNLRAVVGTANRYPEFDELYTYVVDSNHNIQGDESLKPESGYSTSLQWNNRSNFNTFRMENNISTIYMNVDDRIELVNTNPANATFKFLNIDKFESWGVMTSHKLKFQQLTFQVGASVIGYSKSLYSNSYGVDDSIEGKFRYTWEANGSINYSPKHWGTTFSVYYKYNGKTSEYILDPENSTADQTIYRLAETEDFNMMDASVRKSLFKDRFELTLGVRNLFDVTTIKTETPGEGHSTTVSSLPLFYGRSYFLKLNFNLEF